MIAQNVINTVYTAHTVAITQSTSFLKDRFDSDKKLPITDTNKKNKLPLLKAGPVKKSSKIKEKVAALKSDRSLFSRLFIACQSRDGNLQEFFKHENQPFPPSLTEAGTLSSGKKADLAKCLEKMGETIRETPEVDAKIIDGAVIVQMLRPSTARSFQEYADNVFMPQIIKQMEGVKTGRHLG